MEYRVNCNIVWDIESELCFEDVTELAKNQLKDKILSGDAKIILNIDFLKDRNKPIRIGQINHDDFYPYIGFKAPKKEFSFDDATYSVKMNSSRYALFKANPNCVSCGLKGEFLFLEKNPIDKTAHVNCYAKDGNEYVMMTKDHIKARSIGGQDKLENYQTMCQICNNLKSDYNLKTEHVAHLKKIYLENKNNVPQKKLFELISFERDRLHKPWHPKPSNQYVIVEDLELIETNGMLVSQPQENGQIKKGSIVNCTLVAKKDILVSFENITFLVSKDYISNILT